MANPTAYRQPKRMPIPNPSLQPLAIIEKCPVQYHAPVYLAVQNCGVPIQEIYGSDRSLKEFHDNEFGKSISFGHGLRVSEGCKFLHRRAANESTELEIKATGIEQVLDQVAPAAALVSGYGTSFDREVIRCVLRRKTPLIFRAETTDHAVKRPWYKQIVRDVMLKRLYKRFDSLLYIGQRSLKHYQRLGVPADKLIHSPYCINPLPFQFGESDRELLRHKTRAELSIRPDQMLVMFSGKLSWRKGVDLIPKAIRSLSSELRSQVVLGFLGDGLEKENLKQDCALGPDSLEVRFIGFQKQEDLSQYYHAADLTVLPSRSGETWGLAVNESLHHGVRCIVSDEVGCSVDLISQGRNGSVFKSQDVADFSRCLELSLRQENNSQTREFCRDSVATHSVAMAANGIVAAFARVQAR